MPTPAHKAVTDWPVAFIFIVGTAVAVCLCLGAPDGDRGVRDRVVAAGVLHDRGGVVDVVPAGRGDPPPGAFETLMRWINQPSAVVALGVIAVGVVLIVVLRPRGPRE